MDKCVVSLGLTWYFSCRQKEMLPTTKAWWRIENPCNFLSLLTPWQKYHSGWGCVPLLPNNYTKFYLVRPFERSYAAISSFISISLHISSLMQPPDHTCRIQCLEPKRTQKRCGAFNKAHALEINHNIKDDIHYDRNMKLNLNWNTKFNNWITIFHWCK